MSPKKRDSSCFLRTYGTWSIHIAYAVHAFQAVLHISTLVACLITRPPELDRKATSNMSVASSAC